MKMIGAALALLAMASNAQAAGLCPAWGPPEKAGALDMAQLSNTSGLAASTAFPGRLYHHNDAQGGPVFFVSNEAGGDLKKITISGFSPQDLEEVSAGPCAGASSCVYIADFGDNAVNRTSMTFAVLAEKASYAEIETPIRLITTRYPDGPHNAEGMAVHPNGDLFVLTKINRGEPATILYRLDLPQGVRLDDYGASRTLLPNVPSPPLDPNRAYSDLQVATRIDLAKLMTPAGGAAPTRMVQATGMDISPDGKTFVILTYGGAVELNFDLSQPLPPQDQWVAGRDYRLIETATLPQAEGIAYAADGKSILYTSEYMRGGPESPIMRQRCVG